MSNQQQQQQQQMKKEADALVQQNNHQKAVELYTNAISIDPTFDLAGTLFSNRSLCHHKLGNNEEALADGISATTLKPAWARGYLRVSVAAESLGKEEQAIEAYQKTLELEPNQEETRQKYMLLFHKHVDELAGKKSQEELKLFGNAQVQEERYEEAVIIYNAAIDIDPMIESAAPIYSNRSLCFMNLGRFQEAYDDGDMAAMIKPGFARGHLRRATAAMKLEKWKESTESYEKYFELDPENAKSDAEVVKNKHQAKKCSEHQEADKKKHERMIEKTRNELMSIQDGNKKEEACWRLFVSQRSDPATCDMALLRVAVESGLDLGVRRSTSAEIARARVQSRQENFLDTFNVLTLLLERRGKTIWKSLAQLDDLLFFIIDVMIRDNIPFVGCELGYACIRKTNPFNPLLLRTLLETGKFDVNAGFATIWPPLFKLLQIQR